MLIDMNRIDVTYGKKLGVVPALKQVSLQVNEGEFLTIMGKSGCGKSTLLNVLGTIREPDGGTYFFDGKDVLQMKDSEKARFRNQNIGFVVQHFALLGERTIYDNIALPLHYMRIGNREIRVRVDRLLEKMELTDKKHKYPYELSGGQCQRTAIARALVTNPKLLLADEPTGALDEETGRNVMKLLQEINKNGTTIIMVTHDSDFAKLGSRSVTMQDGMFTG